MRSTCSLAGPRVDSIQDSLNFVYPCVNSKAGYCGYSAREERKPELSAKFTSAAVQDQIVGLQYIVMNISK